MLDKNSKRFMCAYKFEHISHILKFELDISNSKPEKVAKSTKAPLKNALHFFTYTHIWHIPLNESNG